MDGFNRWSQVVRGPGAVAIAAFHRVKVPELGGDHAPDEGRDGVRLLTIPEPGSPEIYTIDVTSTAALAMLEGFLATGAHVGKVFTWRGAGVGTARRDTIHLTPRRQP